MPMLLDSMNKPLCFNVTIVTAQEVYLKRMYNEDVMMLILCAKTTSTMVYTRR
jgi:hypothetical protein